MLLGEETAVRSLISYEATIPPLRKSQCTDATEVAGMLRQPVSKGLGLLARLLIMRSRALALVDGSVGTIYGAESGLPRDVGLSG